MIFNKKIIGLNAFRGLAALLVFFFHYWTFYKESLPVWADIFSIGHIGVDLFFVLSGFLITLSLWRSENFISYFTKRFWRIAPLVIITTLIFWGIKTDFSVTSFQDLFAHIFFINGFFPQWYHTINPVTWSISVEMAFYLFLPFVWIVLAKKNLKKFIIIFSLFVFISFAYRAGLFFIFEDWSAEKRIIFSEQLWGRLDQFYLGIILATILSPSLRGKTEGQREFLFSIPKNLKLYILFFLASLFLATSALTFYFLQSDFRKIFFGQVFLHFITAGGFFFFLWWFISLADKWKKNIFINIFSFLGEISYGIYIFHFPVLSIISKNIENPVFAFFISIIFTCILSWVSWTFFEKKIISFFRNKNYNKNN